MNQTAIILVDLQNDFIHPRGAYGRAGQSADAISRLPITLAPLLDVLRRQGAWLISTHFTLIEDKNGDPFISDHLKRLRPFLGRGDFAANDWGHALVDELQPADHAIEKLAYSAFYMTRLEWLLRRAEVTHLIFAGIVTNGGVASTVRDAHVRDFRCTVLADGCAAFDDATHRAAIDGLRPVARIVRVDEMIAELKAGA